MATSPQTNQLLLGFIVIASYDKKSLGRYNGLLSDKYNLVENKKTILLAPAKKAKS